MQQARKHAALVFRRAASTSSPPRRAAQLAQRLAEENKTLEDFMDASFENVPLHDAPHRPPKPKVQIPKGSTYNGLRNTLRDLNLHTVRHYGFSTVLD